MPETAVVDAIIKLVEVVLKASDSPGPGGHKSGQKCIVEGLDQGFTCPSLLVSFLRPWLLKCLTLAGAVSRDSLVVRTSRCGRDNPGSNPGHGMATLWQ